MIIIQRWKEKRKKDFSELLQLRSDAYRALSFLCFIFWSSLLRCVCNLILPNNQLCLSSHPFLLPVGWFHLMDAAVRIGDSLLSHSQLLIFKGIWLVAVLVTSLPSLLLVTISDWRVRALVLESGGPGVNSWPYYCVTLDLKSWFSQTTFVNWDSNRMYTVKL